MSNVMPEFVIDSMTDGLFLRINDDHSIDAKVTRVAATGSFRINGELFTVTALTYTRVYPKP